MSHPLIDAVARVSYNAWRLDRPPPETISAPKALLDDFARWIDRCPGEVSPRPFNWQYLPFRVMDVEVRLATEEAD